MASFAWRSSTGARTGPTAAMPWPLASKPEAAGGEGDVETTMAANAASATVKVARRINSSRNISRGISESSSPRISRNNSSNISRGISESSSPRISRNNSSISHGISRNNSRISRGTSNISSRSRNSSTRGVSRSSLHSTQGDGVHHALVSGVVNTGIFCRSAVQYPPRVLLTRT
ncbi:unnamed protein product, partial [Ascophyllum nodosum]